MITIDEDELPLIMQAVNYYGHNKPGLSFEERRTFHDLFDRLETKGYAALDLCRSIRAKGT